MTQGYARANYERLKTLTPERVAQLERRIAENLIRAHADDARDLLAVIADWRRMYEHESVAANAVQSCEVAIESARQSERARCAGKAREMARTIGATRGSSIWQTCEEIAAAIERGDSPAPRSARNNPNNAIGGSAERDTQCSAERAVLRLPPPERRKYFDASPVTPAEEDLAQ